MVSSFFSTWLWSRTKSHWASSAFGDQAMAPSYLSSAKEYWWARRCSVLLQSLLARCQFLCTLITSKELESDDNGGAMKNHNKLWGCIEMDLFRSWGTNKTSVLCYSRFKKKKTVRVSQTPWLESTVRTQEIRHSNQCILTCLQVLHKSVAEMRLPFGLLYTCCIHVVTEPLNRIFGVEDKLGSRTDSDVKTKKELHHLDVNRRRNSYSEEVLKQVLRGTIHRSLTIALSYGWCAHCVCVRVLPFRFMFPLVSFYLMEINCQFSGLHETWIWVLWHKPVI